MSVITIRNTFRDGCFPDGGHIEGKTLGRLVDQRDPGSGTYGWIGRGQAPLNRAYVSETDLLIVEEGSLGNGLSLSRASWRDDRRQEDHDT